MPRFEGKDLIVFDLDGTLTESKSDMDSEMAGLLTRLLLRRKVAVIGGGSYEQFRRQFTSHLHSSPQLLRNLFLFPTTAMAFYRYDRGWKKVYKKVFSPSERRMIKAAFRKALKDAGYVRPKKVYGTLVEDRGSQITFSALGQDIVKALGARGVAQKERWRREHTDLKMQIARILQRLLPAFEVHAAGYTSVDVTRKGIDKAYGIREIERRLGVSTDRTLFVGDALFPGGNDYAARRTGVECIAVRGPRDTKQLIRRLIAAD